MTQNQLPSTSKIDSKRNFLRTLSNYLNKRHSKWFAAIEQSGLSANSFLYSLIVLYFGDVYELGLYGFWVVVCQLMAMSVMGMTIRQMVLNASNSPYSDQRLTLGATLRIVLWLQVFQTTIIVTIVALWPKAPQIVPFAIFLIVYVLALNVSELLRQFLYMRNKQRFSVVYTAIGLSCGVAMFLVAAIVMSKDEVGNYAFLFLAIGHGLYVVLAVSKVANLNDVWVKSRKNTKTVLQDNWKYGKLATAGMAITWFQNQSVTPILMIIFGPLVVGYYQVARMITTPLGMVLAGLGKNALPQLTRSFRNGGIEALKLSIDGHMKSTVKVICVYLVVAVVILGFVVMYQDRQDWSYLIPMIISTVIVLILSNIRFWHSQLYIVRLRYTMLLRIGLIACLMALTAMFLVGYGFKIAFLPVLCSAFGEIFLIFRIRKNLRMEFQ